ncbi:NAD(P)-dependent glycerol-3-phosphate dehydrogenase [Aurantimonas sp. MSK8Z-1]|uniref:NAD(P)H-dependent glycerol-3-phosphate dehydrogenase n=1 Tax=Mangrovibrevibacter kandeliae TaxID=2968473 RepID=UPI00211878DE|nr:NAD(P)H-dependent glycerol-3-phosphate dehydrogenase [Aurantimonas sp. MSK8Z-1]MCW4115394.1 NAD(P)-dependent glycerol-3-phosphate dehydrogenase [Aurantimonas sp. MSK8Z-1]
MSRIAVIGGGAWGTALASAYARAGHATTLYARDAATVASINERRRNERYLPGIELPADLAATADPGAALAGAATVLMVVPAQALRGALRDLTPLLPPDAPVILCSKGIERSTGLFASQVLADVLPQARAGILSGPSFATDVAAGLPTAVTVAAPGPADAAALAETLSTAALRCYATDDMLGVEAGGALKNVLAIAAGIVAGRGLGASASAALVTRGFVELRRLGEALGARPDTLMGLSGLGDLILTCSGAQSRNFAYGLAVGRGDDLSGLKLAEGAFSAGITARLADERGVEAPIIATVAAILAGTVSVEAAIQTLLARPLKREAD